MYLSCSQNQAQSHDSFCPIQVGYYVLIWFLILFEMFFTSMVYRYKRNKEVLKMLWNWFFKLFKMGRVLEKPQWVSIFHFQLCVSLLTFFQLLHQRFRRQILWSNTERFLSCQYAEKNKIEHRLKIMQQDLSGIIILWHGILI